MLRPRLLAGLLAGTAGALAPLAAGPFADVPRDHWAYPHIQRVLDAGIMEGYDGSFLGKRLINRYQMALIVQRTLDAVAREGGAASAGVDAGDVTALKAAAKEFADELRLIPRRVDALEQALEQLRGDIDATKMGSSAPAKLAEGGGLASAFSGMVSVGVVVTDDGAAGIPPVGGFAGPTRTRFHGANAGQTFFTLPQASVALDKELRDGVRLHVQYDYQTDGAAAAATPGVGAGQGVGLNEAYLEVDEPFGKQGVDAKIGGFALPFQSWEVDGPFRTGTRSISPSAKNRLLEGFRVLGVELSNGEACKAGFDWRLGVFTGADVPAQGAPGLPPLTAGGFSDAAGLGALSASPTLEDAVGFYLDLESKPDPERKWGWRLGFFDNGGDADGAPLVPLGAPVAGLANSQEIDGWQAGLWWKSNVTTIQVEYLDLDSAASFGPGVLGNETDIRAWYAMLNVAAWKRSSLTLRVDGWENATNVPAGTTGAAAGLEGQAITFAWNRHLSDRSMLQLEWISPDEEHVAPAAAAAAQDVRDDLLQLRYKVWF